MKENTINNMRQSRKLLSNYWYETWRSTFIAVLLVPAALLVSSISLAADEEKIIELPIADDLQVELQRTFVEVKQSIPGYKPRTEHLHKDGAPHYVNRLIREDSPYLLQHAHNPINWYSWGEEALQAARDTNRPVFLSIGYATCHWCHVMEREVFEKLDVAEYMNENFIAIKVDREQHPDVDQTYMTAVQMITGRGGWPLSAWLTPDAKPFYAGTYFPKETFEDLQDRIIAAWTEQNDAILVEAEKVASALREVNQLSAAASAIEDTQIDESVELVLTGYDDLQGGFGGAPKFPRESDLLMLLQKAMTGGEKSDEALQAAYFTLQRIAAGGIHDHVAGGFHRYTVDDDWLIPHFEKMLYNQAYLARAFIRSYLLTGDWEHGRIASRTLDYVLREMTSPDGTFYSATDADSEGVEGKFFVWSEAELNEVLSEEEAKLARRVWRTSAEGNFEGENILRMDGPYEDVAKEIRIPVEELLTQLDAISAKLLTQRAERIPPLRDEKIIVGWNSMLITTLAESSAALGKEDYLQAAVRAAESLLGSQLGEDGELQRITYNGRQSVNANQSDYALMAEAMVQLFDATEDKKWLAQAESLVAKMNELFHDKESGGYFMGAASVSGAELPVRPKSIYDNSAPSGNSVALRVLSRLFYRTGNDEYLTRAEELLAAFSGQVKRSPTAFGYMMASAQEMFSGELGQVQYAGRGHVRLSAEVEGVDNNSEASKGQVKISLKIDDGWHINAEKPVQDYLIGTRISNADDSGLVDVDYPEPVMRTLGFDRSELALYEDKVEIRVPVEQLQLAAAKQNENSDERDASLTTVSLKVDLQACDDTTCLAPETIEIKISTATPGPWNPALALVR